MAIAGFLVMMGPVYWWAAHVLWQNDDHVHGAIVLAVVAWLFWTLRDRIAAVEGRPAPIVGGLLFGFGLLLYVAGRTFDLWLLEVGCQTPVVAGALLLLKGPAAVRIAWFPLFYLFFMIPLPGIWLDAVTGPLRLWTSSIVTTLLYDAGYPIAQSGVVISIGPYQFLVADVAPGLHSIFSLLALGLLFVYIRRKKSAHRNAIMFASTMPIALVANLVGTMLVVLTTYYLGDQAGQALVGWPIGIVDTLVALLLLSGLESLLDFLGRDWGKPPEPLGDGWDVAR
jgi:exosortase B